MINIKKKLLLIRIIKMVNKKIKKEKIKLIKCIKDNVQISMKSI